MFDLWGCSIGSTIKALELLKALSDCGHEVKDYWMRDDLARKNFDGEWDESTTKKFLKKYLSKYLHEPKQLFKNLNSIRREQAILEAEKPDLVISRLDVFVYSPVVLKRKFQIPFIIEIDSPRSYEKITYQSHYRVTKSLLRRMELEFIRAGDASFTVSNQIKKHFVDRGIPEDFIHVIPNGADATRFSPDIPATAVMEKYHLHDSVVIGFVGSFIYWHGVENLTFIIEKIVKRHDQVKFLMVGQGGPMETLLRNFIRDNRLEDKVIFTGFISHDDVPQYISAMDIVLAPYPDIDFFYYSPVKIYEYMSCGKPVISSRIGQIAEVIRDRETGFLTKPNDIEMICQNISELIENPELRKRIGKAAREEILNKHTWQKRGEQLSALCSQYS